MEPNDKIILQVQIITFGQDGIDRLASHNHPAVKGVSWLVSIQAPDGEITIPESLRHREDFDFVIHNDRGAAKNRNHALDFKCDSELILLSDDDLDYTDIALKQLIDAFRTHPDAEMICCRYTCFGKLVKNYGEGEFSLDKTPFGWYPSAVEIAFRRKSLGNVRFNENFGPGSGGFIAGDDSVWYVDMLRKGVNGIGMPITICSHDAPTQSLKQQTNPEFLKSYGACMIHSKPYSWLPRLFLHAHRTPMPFFKCLRYTFTGAILAVRKRVFR